MNMTPQAAAAAQTDESLMALFFTYVGREARDGQGNLRELTADEEALGAALRAEAKRRGLL